MTDLRDRLEPACAAITQPSIGYRPVSESDLDALRPCEICFGEVSAADIELALDEMVVSCGDHACTYHKSREVGEIAHTGGINRDTPAAMLADMDPEEAGLSPLGGGD